MKHAEAGPGVHKDLLVNRGEDPNARPARFARATGDTLDFRNAGEA